MNISYDYLRIFYYVGRYQSFSQAAKVLQNSQPNITRYMNNLEASFGCKLLHRSNKGISLTPEGELLFRRVSVMHEQANLAEEEIGEAKGLKAGHITIGRSIGAAGEPLQVTFLPYLRDFHHDYPGVHIRIISYSTPETISKVLDGSLDFGIITTSTSHIPAGLSGIHLESYQDMLFAGRFFDELEGGIQHLGDLGDYPLIMLGSDTETYQFYEAVYAKYGLVLSPDIEVTSNEQILPLIRGDMGLGFVPTTVAAEALSAHDVFPINLAEELPIRHISIVYNEKTPKSTAGEAFIERLI